MKYLYPFFLLFAVGICLGQTSRYSVNGTVLLEGRQDFSGIAVVFSKTSSGLVTDFYSSVTIGSYSYAEAASLLNTLPYPVTVSKVAFFDGQNNLIAQTTDSTVLNGSRVGPDSSIGLSLSHQIPPALTAVSQYYVIWYCAVGDYSFQIRSNYNAAPFSASSRNVRPAFLTESVKPHSLGTAIKDYPSALLANPQTLQMTQSSLDTVYTDSTGFFSAQIDSGVYDIAVFEPGYTVKRLTAYLVLSPRRLPPDTLRILPPVAALVAHNLTPPNAAVGDSSVCHIVLFAANTSPLKVDSISSSLRIFHIAMSVPFSVPGNDSVSVPVIFTPVRFGVFNDTVSVFTDGGTVSACISAGSPYPVFSPTADSISFGAVAIGDTVARAIRIANPSLNALTIDSLYADSGVFRFDTDRDTVSHGDTATIAVSFSPAAFGRINDTLYIRTNALQTIFAIPLSASSPSPGITLANRLDIFHAIAGQSQDQILRLTNISPNALVVDSARTDTKYFHILQMNNPDTLRIGDTINVGIVFTPDSVKTYQDSLVVYSNASELPVKLPLQGTASPSTFVSGDQPVTPATYELYQNFPNPFNPSTIIRFAVPARSHVTVTIYDVLGRQIQRLVDGAYQPGYYKLTWNASSMASGIYFYRIVAQATGVHRADFVMVKKLLLLK